jgi:hypothetical protein
MNPVGHMVAQLIENLLSSWKVTGSISNGVLEFFIDIMFAVALWQWD